MKRKKISDNILTLTVILLALCSMAFGQTEDKLYRIAVFANQGKDKCLERWKDTADYLTKEIENASFVIIPLNTDKINLAGQSGHFDFFIVNPAVYIKMAVLYNAESIATLKTLYADTPAKNYGTVILTRADREDINTLEDLKNKNIIATNEHSLGGFILAQKEFLDANINYPDDFKQFIFSGANEHVVYAVGDNATDAGIIRTGVLEEMQAQGKINISDFKVLISKSDSTYKNHQSYPFLHSAKLYPEWPFVKAEQTSSEMAERVILALLSIQQNDLCATAGKYAGWAVPMNYQSVKDCLRQLRIDPYQNYGIITSQALFQQYKVRILLISAILAGMFVTVVVISILNSHLKKSQSALKSEIYERKTITDKLKKSEKRFVEIAENASEWIWEIDVNGLYIYSSSAVEDVLGYSVDEVIGKKYFYDFFSEEVRQQNKKNAFELLDKKENLKNFTAAYTHKDGRQVWLSTSGVPILDEQGKFIGYRGSDIDITRQKQDEEKINISRQNLLTMLDSVPFGVMVVGRDKKIRRINEAAVKMSGFDSKDELVGHICHKTLCPAQANNCPMLDANQRVDRSEKILSKKDKTEVPILKSVVPIHLDGEDVLLECFIDITERKNSDEALKRYVSLLKTTLDSTVDGILVVDNQGKIINLNEKFKQLWKIPADAFNAGRGNKIIEQILGHLKDPNQFLEKVKYLYNNPKEVSSETFKLNTDEVFECYSQPHTIDDEVIGRVWSFRDITDKKNAEEQKLALLERAKIQENAIYQLSVNDAIIAGDIEEGLKKITEITSKVMGVKRAGVWLFSDDHRQLQCSDMYDSLSSTHSKGIVINIADCPGYFEALKDGKPIDVADVINDPRTGEFAESYLKPLGIDSMLDVAICVSGKTIGVLCCESVGIRRQWTNDEITFAGKISDHLAIAFMNASRVQIQRKLKSLNTELRESNKELQRFTYVASHDLREPLRKISAFGNLLDASLKGKLGQDDAENLAFMIEGASRLSKMIEGLLIYSRINTTASKLENVDLNEILEQIREPELAVLLEKTNAEIKIPEPLPAVEVDPTQIYQLFQNIITNSIKFQPEGANPCITITSKPAPDGMTKIEITDNGIGIKPEYQQAIFNMFKRMNTGKKYMGTGIGLSICKKIVEHYKGTIGVESQPEKGATFWFTLPQAKVEAEITV
ncbi:MAG: PAS domain S-box protein [Anaerohalosphaeraceae bacterium]|nr:PAS domain S-box protein [Anaerohalosphaeraceae bacterium]